MWIRILIVALGVAWVVTLIGIIWLLAISGLPPRNLLLWLSTMDPVLQLCCVLSIGSVAFGVISLRAGARRRAWISVASASGWSILGATLRAVTARDMLINMNDPIPFAIFAPNYAEALVVLLVGITGTLLGLVLLSRSSSSDRAAGQS